MTAAHQNAPGELLPCPFCGSGARTEVYPSGEDESDHWVVQCYGCGATNGDNKAESTPDQEYAVTAWNSRAALNARPQPAQVDSLLGFPIVIDDKLPPYQVRVVSGGRTHLFTLDMDAGTATPTPPPTSASPQVVVVDADEAMHWIDRYAAGIDDECQLDRVAAAISIQPPAVSAEWVVVPRVPTEAMIDAGHAAYETAMLGNRKDVSAAFLRRWSAMIEAAPKVAP